MQYKTIENIHSKMTQLERTDSTGNFSLLFYCGPALRRNDGSRISTPHSLLDEKFSVVGIHATAFAISNDCLVVRVPDSELLLEENFGETLRISERLPQKRDRIRVSVKVTFSNNGTGRKAKKYGAGRCLEQLIERCGLSLIPGSDPQVTPIPDQYRQGVSIIGIYQIEGCFELNSCERFREALRSGVGARRSYGFGVIIYEIMRCENRSLGIGA